MEFNPKSLNQFGPPPGTELPRDTGAEFKGVRPNELTAGDLQSRPLTGQFSRTDLDNVDNHDQMVQSALQEMLGADMQSRGLGPTDQQNILNWMSNDPTFRSLAMEYLGQVLQ